MTAEAPALADRPQNSGVLVLAVGDVRYRSIKRVVSAVGDGATAVRLTQEYLSAEDPAVSP